MRKELRLILKYLVSLDDMPPQTHGCGDDWAVAIQRKSSNVGDVPQNFPSLLVLPTKEWQRDNMHHLCFPLKM